MIEVIAAKKEKLADETAVRQALAKLRPGSTVQSVTDDGKDGWVIRLADVPPFLKNKDKDVDPDGDGDGDDDTSPATDTDNDGGDSKSDQPKDKSDKSEKGGDVASEIKDLISQLQDVLKQVTDKAGEAVSEVEDHRDKLDKAKDALGDGEGEGLPGMSPDAAPPMPADVGPPRPPRRPGVPSGNGMRPGMPSAFTKRRTEILSHAGVDKAGNSLTLLEAANALESDPEWNDYKIVGMTENSDGSFSAKLRLRS